MSSISHALLTILRRSATRTKHIDGFEGMANAAGEV